MLECTFAGNTFTDVQVLFNEIKTLHIAPTMASIDEEDIATLQVFLVGGGMRMPSLVGMLYETLIEKGVDVAKIKTVTSDDATVSVAKGAEKYVRLPNVYIVARSSTADVFSDPASTATTSLFMPSANSNLYPLGHIVPFSHALTNVS
jgi:hypothetical protein